MEIKMTSDWLRCILVVLLNIAKVLAENGRMKRKKKRELQKKKSITKGQEEISNEKYCKTEVRWKNRNINRNFKILQQSIDRNTTVFLEQESNLFQTNARFIINDSVVRQLDLETKTITGTFYRDITKLSWNYS